MKCNEIVCMLQSIVEFFDAEKSKGAFSFRLLQRHFSVGETIAQWHIDTVRSNGTTAAAARTAEQKEQR